MIFQGCCKDNNTTTYEMLEITILMLIRIIIIITTPRGMISTKVVWACHIRQGGGGESTFVVLPTEANSTKFCWEE